MTINITKKIFIEIDCELKQLKGGYNWYTLTIINLYFEKDGWGGYEAWFTLLGFTLMVRYNTDKALKQFDEWSDEWDEGESMTLEELKKELK